MKIHPSLQNSGEIFIPFAAQAFCFVFGFVCLFFCFFCYDDRLCPDLMFCFTQNFECNDNMMKLFSALTVKENCFQQRVETCVTTFKRGTLWWLFSLFPLVPTYEVRLIYLLFNEHENAAKFLELTKIKRVWESSFWGLMGKPRLAFTNLLVSFLTYDSCRETFVQGSGLVDF